MGTGEFYKARYEKTLDACKDFYDEKQPLITDAGAPSEFVNRTDHEMNPENSKIDQNATITKDAETELADALFVPV